MKGSGLTGRLALIWHLRQVNNLVSETQHIAYKIGKTRTNEAKSFGRCILRKKGRVPGPTRSLHELSRPRLFYCRSCFGCCNSVLIVLEGLHTLTDSRTN